MSSRFLTAEWRKLIMAQYPVAPAVLAPWLPAAVELDYFHSSPGQPLCFVSLVGFLFQRVRVMGIAVPFHTTFEEINLRFYVRRTEPDGTCRRGVIFIREFVPRAAITLVANTLYEEPYATCPTWHHFSAGPHSQRVEYGWKREGGWHSIGVNASLESQFIVPDSIEEFITEHYWGFTKRTRGAVSQYQVEHPRWRTYPIVEHKIEADFAALYGPAFASLTHQQPHSVLLAEGSEVAVYSGTRLA